MANRNAMRVFGSDSYALLFFLLLLVTSLNFRCMLLTSSPLSFSLMWRFFSIRIYHAITGDKHRSLKSHYEAHIETFQVYIFQSVQNLAYFFFKLNICTKISLPLRGGGQAQGPPKYAPVYRLGLYSL